MKTRKEIKKEARAVLKRHYVIFMLTCIILGFLGIEFSYSFSSAKTSSSLTETVNNEEVEGIREQIKAIIASRADGAKEKTDGVVTSVGYDNGIVDVFSKNVDQNQDSNTPLGKIFGHKRGVFAGIVNGISQGKLYVKLFDAFFTLFQSPGLAVVLMLLVSIGFSIFVWMFFSNMLRAVARRIFLEARMYKKVPYNRFLYFFAIKKWTKTAINLFVWQLQETLWFLTIVGGFIKHYSYAMTPFILCENPDLSAKEAITLSRKMMDGHKFELFKQDLSFIGWELLSGLTAGLSGIFYSNPYQAAAEVEYYAELRKISKEKGIPGTELLQDNYLFELADQDLLTREYADAVELFTKPRVESEYLKGAKAAIAKATSLVLFIDKDVKAVEEVRNEKNHLRHEKDCVLGEAYPDRLSPIAKEPHRKWVNTVNYNRYYSVWNVLLMFITFCFIGWCWEVSLHIIQDGTFVNRGMLHGPWIPIYGSGGMLILIVLTKLRKSPIMEFIAAIVLCGILEYMTSLIVEISKGKRWWDYTGYFLNLNGRICAEGLLVFGVMGMVIVYAVAPLIDHYLRQIPHKVIVPLSLVLMAIFGADCVYSHYYPNEGKGITDYEQNEVIKKESGKM